MDILLYVSLVQKIIFPEEYQSSEYNSLTVERCHTAVERQW